MSVLMLQRSKVQTANSIFSSCCVIKCSAVTDGGLDPESKLLIICGSHDKNLYCWNRNLEQEWRTNLGCEVYSVPFCHQVYCRGSADAVLCVSVPTTDGVLYTLDVRSGQVLLQTHLPGQSYSSPVCMGNCVVLGCRDNHVYCMGLTTD